MSGAMNRHCIPGFNYVHSLTGNLCGECPGIIKTMHTGLSAQYCIMPTPGADTEETGRADVVWKIR